MRPRYFEKWLKSDRVIGQYYDLLQSVSGRIENRLGPILDSFLTSSIATPSQEYRARVYWSVRQEMQSLEAQARVATGRVFQSFERENVMYFQKAIAPKITGSYRGFSTFAAKKISGVESDVGTRIGKYIREYSDKYSRSVVQGMAEAGKAIKAGEASGASFGEILTDLRQNVIGLKPGQRVAGLTADLTRLVRTESAHLNHEIFREYGEEADEIVGVQFQRGPGVCTTDICGEVLGVAENEIAYFLYEDGVPHAPLHPNSYGDIVGYIFAWEAKMINNAERDFARVDSRGLFQSALKGGKQYQVAARQYSKDFYRKNKAA